MALQIKAEETYREEDLITFHGFTSAELKRGRKEGLRCKEVGRGKRVYLGQWVLTWLTGEPTPAGGPGREE